MDDDFFKSANDGGGLIAQVISIVMGGVSGRLFLIAPLIQSLKTIFINTGLLTSFVDTLSVL